MASSRDDFIIAIRSAFLKKSTQQKFSLLTLVFISIFIIVLSSFDLKFIRYLKAGLTFKQIDYEWMNTAKKLTLFCWSMLTGGIALGSYWAYYFR